MRIRSTALLAALFLAAAVQPAFAQPLPVNPGFEEGAGEPSGWRLNPAPHYAVVLDSVDAHEGRRAARITGQAGGGSGEFGSLSQGMDAAPYRGKRVRYRAWVRSELAPGPANHTGLWLRVDRPNGRMGFFDNMNARPITGRTGWRAYEIVGDVADDAQAITFGMLLVGAGQAWLDETSFEVIGDAPGPEAARPLTERGVENLAAFTRLLGYVRYFHPSDQAAATDWNAFAAAGIRTVEGAADSVRLAAVLDSLFRPLAPTIVIHPGTPAYALVPLPRGDSIRWWRHYGVGMNERSLYRSARSSIAAAGALPDTVPDPEQRLTVELGGGVSAVIPLALYTQGGATLPAAPVPAAEPFVPGSGDDRATRLAAVALGWNVFQHFYPYFDVADADWAAELPRALRAAAADAGECEFLGSLRRMVAALDDGHGRVGHACEGRPGMPPVRVEAVEGRPTVTAVGPGAVGVQRGDVVLRIDGAPADSIVRARTELVSAATPQWGRYVVHAGLLTGRDSVVRVTVQHVNGDTATVQLRRAVGVPVAEGKPEPVAEVRPGIWYVDLDRVTNEQLQAALPSLQAARGLVFDMRGYPDWLNPGLLFSHLLREPGTSAQWHIPVVTRPDREGLRFSQSGSWQLGPAEPYLSAPRAFITDGSAISFAESVMGIVEAYRLGEIVGGATAGTNGNVNPFLLPGGYTVSWTGMKVLKHDGSRHHGVGILPTVPVERTRAGVAAGRDELLERAIEVVSSGEAAGTR